MISNIRVVSGPPAATIAKEAEEPDVNLVVIGAHAEFSFKRAFFGSTARKVTHLSRKPDLVVPMSDTNTWGR